MTLRTSAAGGLSRFAHLTGISRKRADDTPATDDDVQEVQDAVDEVKDNVDDVKDDLDETKDKVKELEEELDSKKDDDEPMDDKPDEQAAFRRGRVAGRKAERARCAAIFAMPEAAQNLPLAASLAFESRSSATEARALLRAGVDGAAARAEATAASPPAPTSPLDQRMSGSPRVVLGSAAPATGAPTTSKGLAEAAVALARSAGIVK